MNPKTLARNISLIENEAAGFEKILRSLKSEKKVPLIGITGAPGAGKSTLVDALIGKIIEANKKVAVVCVDPSSPFNLGALLGDRVRMSNWYTNPNVFIRSLATRGSLGGLHPRIIEITDLLQSADFDYIIVETVGVGQSEVEIAGLADVTIVVLVPEGGDEVQTMKAGLMEIADIFVVNKSDRPDAAQFVKNLHLMLSPAYRHDGNEIPVVQTVANDNRGIDELKQKIDEIVNRHQSNNKRIWLLTERAYQLISKSRMKNTSKEKLQEEIRLLLEKDQFNLYQFVENHI